jgi:preprotein translocase subunit SecE
MKNLIKKIKIAFSAIHWPACKETVSDTLFVVVTTIALSTAILLWLSIIENVINKII